MCYLYFKIVFCVEALSVEAARRPAGRQAIVDPSRYELLLGGGWRRVVLGELSVTFFVATSDC